MRIAPEDRDKLLKDYSHGMKNKMQMLVNIIAEPNVLLLDEPLTSLDVVVAEEMKQLLRAENRARHDFLDAPDGPRARPVRRKSCCSATGSWRSSRKRISTAASSRIRSSPRSGEETMRKTLGASFALRNTYRVNSILYAIKQLPLIGRALPENAVQRAGSQNPREYPLRAVGGVRGVPRQAGLSFLTMVLGAGLLYEQAAASGAFLHIFFFLTAIGAYMNHEPFQPDAR